MALNIFLFVGVFVAGITHVLQLVTTLLSANLDFVNNNRKVRTKTQFGEFFKSHYTTFFSP